MPWSLIGADRAKSQLSGMILRGRLPHALLITGPRGGGRRTMAMDLAKAANCLRPDPDGAPCQECLSCRKADSGNHPDIFTVVSGKRSRVIDIDSIRALRDRLAFRPFEGRAKVAVVPGAEDMSREGSGALLKTLEEPSEASLIILTSLSASMVLETLVSRSVVIKLPPLPRRRLIEAIGAGRGISGPAAELLAGLSAGALGQACGMDPDKASSMWGALGEVFGGGSRGERISSAMDFTERHLQEAYPKRGGAAPEDPSEASERLEAEDLFKRAVRLWLRDALILKATGDAGLMEGPPPDAHMLAFVERSTLKGLGGSEGALARLFDSVSRNIRPDLAFENFWLSVL